MGLMIEEELEAVGFWFSFDLRRMHARCDKWSIPLTRWWKHLVVASGVSKP